MLELFTPASRQAVTDTQEEARKLNHSAIDCEHLLLGILAGGSEAAQWLGGYMLTYQEVEGEILKIHPKGDTPSPRHLLFTHEAKTVISEAVKIANQYTPPSADTEYLALALLDAANPTIDKVLSELEVDKSLVRDDLIDLARNKAHARGAVFVAENEASPGSGTSLSPRTKLIRLLEDGSIPQRNLINALMVFARDIDNDLADEIVAILEK